MSETTRSRPRLDYSALLRSAKATPKPGFSGWWSYIEFQPDIFSPQRFPIGVVVQADDERLYFKLLDDFKKFDCVYPEGFPHSSAKALMAYAYGVLQAAIKEKTPLSQILFDSHVLSLSRPVHTSGSDREAAVERLFSDVVAMVPSNVKKVREFASIDTAAARKLVNEKLKEIAAMAKPIAERPCASCRYHWPPNKPTPSGRVHQTALCRAIRTIETKYPVAVSVALAWDGLCGPSRALWVEKNDR